MAVELYIWRPNGIDEHVVLVVEDSPEKAKAAADAYVAERVASGCEDDYHGWGTKYYEGPETYPVGTVTNLWF